MSAFTGPLTITEMDADSDWWFLIEPLVWEVAALGTGIFIVVPAGEGSDGASIPWPVSIVFPRWGRKYRRPAVLHDYLCNLLAAGTPHTQAPSRGIADRIFREAMAACGVSLPVRWAFYLAVRLAVMAEDTIRSLKG